MAGGKASEGLAGPLWGFLNNLHKVHNAGGVIQVASGCEGRSYGELAGGSVFLSW